jgi:hypothetical protein
MTDDYSYGWEHRARITELQDIAAMDRLAAQVAPPSALRRYAASRAARRPDRARRSWWGGLRHPRAHAVR